MNNTDDRRSDLGLDELDRRTRDRWVVAAIVVIGLAVAAVMLLDDAVAEEQRPWVAAAFGAVAVLYLISVVVEERRRRRTLAALVRERERAAALAARVRALETLHDAARDVAAASDLPEVFAGLVDAALRLTHARSGAVLLRVGDTLTVAASAGPGSPERGTEVPAGTGPAWAAVTAGEPVPAMQGAEWAASGAGSVAAPLKLQDRVVGALVVERGEDAPPFSEADRIAVALFAEHAALAVRNAARRADDLERVATVEEELKVRAAAAAELVHDLRSPVAAVAGYVQLLRERDPDLGPDRRHRVLVDVMAELDRVRRMLEDLLAALSADADLDRPVEADIVDLVDVVHEAVRTGRGIAQRVGAEPDFVLELPSSATVVGDRDALIRVVTNLLDNAVRYAPTGTSIDVEVEADDREVWLRIRDRGPGLAEPGEGTGRSGGLGLQVVRSLVRAHGGEVAIDAAEGGGTVAEVRLPRS